MKKIMMTLMAAVMAASVSAQAYVGGGLGVATASDGDNDVTVFKFVPEVGFNLNEDWSVGAAFGWEGAKEAQKTFSFNPYARYTLLHGKVVNAFIDGGVEYAHTYNAGADLVSFSVGLKPGLAVNLNNRVSFVAHFGFIGYQHEKDNNYKGKEDMWGIDLDGRNITFGLYYNF